MRRSTAAFLALGAAALAGVAVEWLHLPDAGWEPRAGTDAAPAAAAEAGLARRGEYLVRAGDCIACHTAQGGAEYAGGRPVPTPFGTIYSSNLTPDPETGLGAWSADDFWGALHFGRSRDGRRLYPAFPYPSYTLVSRGDADAMFAYLRSRPPVRKPPTPSALRFPYDTQAALAIWRALYFRPAAFQPDATQPLAWNRGAYLVEGLGHCGACHTRRTWLGGLERSRAYAGGPIPMLGWDALPLTSEKPLTDAQAAEMAELLKAGTSRHGVASGPMAEVVFRSLQYLDDADIAAIVAYVRALPYQAPARRTQFGAPAAQREALTRRGAEVYADRCADCHGKDGQGEPYKYPALAGNPLVIDDSPANAIEAVLFGGYGASTAAVPMPYGMPPYSHQLSRRDVAAVLTYVRGAWGNDAPAVPVAAVERH